MRKELQYEREREREREREKQYFREIAGEINILH